MRAHSIPKARTEGRRESLPYKLGMASSTRRGGTKLSSFSLAYTGVLTLPDLTLHTQAARTSNREDGDDPIVVGESAAPFLDSLVTFSGILFQPLRQRNSGGCQGSAVSICISRSGCRAIFPGKTMPVSSNSNDLFGSASHQIS